ncbi:TIR domain-containing protein [Oscillatoria sp. FACHB-1407]|uniref:toll/interleukin-1 receptor domain-containing protein n=1 Tax=Oscillatoria sp. FACHB-1407 TaxID=2692847 RepID=UPI0016839DE4|nr:TIR domain-containing protein [Oscillatoria sp. FACHB-1407]MBD2464133.1 TIR domain-containing protein [Oscillatoria sp. FACHB-1407]
MQRFYDVFISYGRTDSKAFAARLHRRLTEYGLTAWFDFEDIPVAVDFQKQIEDGIERTDNFLFIISPYSVNSPYCHLEIELALKWNKRIIPILHVEQITQEIWQQRHPNSTAEEWADYQAKGLHDHYQNMHPVLRKINWIYMREEQDDFEAALARLLNLCDRHKDYVHQHTLLLAKALGWERNQKRSPYLLIGEERLQAEEWLKVRFKDSQPPCLPTDLHCEFITESRKNADNLLTDVFLAYAEEERAIAEQIRNSLRREGFTVWTNITDIHAGADFQQVINRGIEEADNVVYLLSNAAVKSPYCQHELDYALSLHKRIIPVRVEAIAPHEIPAQMRELQYIDLSDNIQEIDYQQDESQLLRILRQDAAYHETYKLLLTKALKWERQQQNPTLLLRGYNLRQAEAWLKVAKQNPAYPPLPLQETFITESLRQPPGLSLDVFISYSRADSGFARRLNDALQVHGKRTWFDQESIAAGTADFQQEIYKGIESSDTFLFVLSPRSVTSPYCADEVEYATKLNKRVVTILHQAIDPSVLHPELAKVQWLDFNQRESDFSANFTDLLRLLDTDTEHLHAHTRLLMRAIEWDTKGRKESLLLRGDELADAEQWLTQSAGKEPKPTELQQTYIVSSRTVEDANQQANQILRTAAAKGKRLVTVGAITGGIGLLVAGVAGFTALQATTKIRVAEVRLQTAASSEQFLSGQPFQALLIALESGQALQDRFRLGSSEWSDLQPRIVVALQQSMNGIGERNTLNNIPGSRDSLTDIKFSPDNRIVTAVGLSTFKMWNAQTGELLQTFGEEENLSMGINLSPDSKTIALHIEDTIQLKDVATGDVLHTFKGHSYGISGTNFSPDGRTIASVGIGDGTIKLWDVATGQQLRTFESNQNVVISVNFSPDGRVITCNNDTTIEMWEVATGKPLPALKGNQSQVVSFSPDGSTIASLGNDNTIKVWDVMTGEPLRTLEGIQDTLNSISFSPNGRTIAADGGDNTIKVWEAATGKLLGTLIQQSSVNSIHFSPDGNILVSLGSDNTIKVWETATGKLLHTFQSNQSVSGIIFSSDGKTLASGSIYGTIKLWDLATGKPFNILEEDGSFPPSIHFNPNSKTLASYSNGTTIKLWDVATGKLLHTLSHQEQVSSIVFSLDGKTIASGSGNETGVYRNNPESHQNAVINIDLSSDQETKDSSNGDNTIHIWDVETGTLLRSFGLRSLGSDQNRVTTMDFSPDGRTLASDSFDNSIDLWNVETGTLLHSLKGHENGISSIKFSPDGKTIASADYNNTIKLWNATTGELLYTFNDIYLGVTNSINFSPDGKTIVSGGSDGVVKVWDVVTGELLHTLEGHQGSVRTVSFSSNGKTIASGSEDSTIKLWNGVTGKLLHTLEIDGIVDTNVSFSSDGEMIASGGFGTIKVWDVDKGELLYTHEGDQGWVTSLSFSPDGKTIASAGDDGTIKLWVWDFDRLMTMGCNWIQQYLITRPDQRYLCEGYLPPNE